MSKSENNRRKIINLLFIFFTFIFFRVFTLSVSANTCTQNYTICSDAAKNVDAEQKKCLFEFNYCSDNVVAFKKKCDADLLSCKIICTSGDSACVDKCSSDFTKCTSAAEVDPAGPPTNVCDTGDKVCKDGCASVYSICITAAGFSAIEVAKCTNTQIGCAAQCNDLTNECKSQAASATTPADTSTPSAPPPESISLPNPLGSKVDIKDMVGEVIKISLGFLGSLALLMFVYGGFLWMTSRGKTESIKQGSTTMLWAAIGIVFVFSSYGLLVFILDLIGAA